MANKQKASTNLGLSSIPEFSSKDYPDIYVDNLKLRNAIGVLQTALDQYTGILGLDPAYWPTAAASQIRLGDYTPMYAIAEVTMVAGNIVNFHDVGGVLKARLADATAAGKPAHAFCAADVGIGSFGEFTLQGICQNIGGLTNGVTYYQSNTPGLIAAGAGTILQRIGFALGPSTLYFRADLV